MFALLRGLLSRRHDADWDLTALLNASVHCSSQVERHVWLIRLLAWVRRPPRRSNRQLPDSLAAISGDRAPWPVLRVRHLLNVLDSDAGHRQSVGALLAAFWRDIDAASLLADVGLAQRMSLFAEAGEQLRLRLLPTSPATNSLGELFGLVFPRAADDWIEAIDDATLERLAALFGTAWRGPQGDSAVQWRQPFCDAVTFVASSVAATGFSSRLRQRMDPLLVADRPFRQLPVAAEAVVSALEEGRDEDALVHVQYLRAVLQRCHHAAESVSGHLEENGVSVDLVFDVDQIALRTARVDDLLTCIVSKSPQRDIAHLVAALVRGLAARRSLRELFARHYSLLARKVAERGAEAGNVYITHDLRGYLSMFRAAVGGGIVLGGTTLMKFAVLALGFSAFWAGLWSGVNYAASFVLIYLLHFTVATKQPAMTAPALARKLEDVATDDAIERFVDEVAALLRSQFAGIFGNLLAVAPVVLAVQWGWRQAFGEPLVGHATSMHTLESLTLLGPTAAYAAFTGVLLFASSMVAGWVENWFVWHRLDTAIAYHPRSVSRLGEARAKRWGAYWRKHVSGITANVSLGLMLGLVPPIVSFFGLPLEVRHVTLSTGQLATALGAEGSGLLHTPEFWWCVAGIVATGLLNLAVSFLFAFRVALRSRGMVRRDRSRINAAVRRRLWRRPLSFAVPPRRAPA